MPLLYQMLYPLHVTSCGDTGTAIEKAYLHGELKGGTSKDTAEELPEGSTKAAKVVAEKQAALAGYRLADEIGEYLK